MTVNSPVEIQKRVAAGKITSAGPLIMLAVRSILALVCQALVATIFFRGTADGWDQAGEWWRVYGTAIDVGCIVLLAWLARREGVRPLDLGSYGGQRWLRDVLIGLALFVPLLLAFAGPTVLLETLLNSGSAPVPGAGLPMAGTLYALLIWPIVWSLAEDNTYFGYALPRLEALTGRKWLGVVVVGLFAALQHIFLPLRLEWQWVVSHFLGYLLGAVLYCLLYQRWRRLLPVHVSHWAINLVGVIMVMLSAGSR